MQDELCNRSLYHGSRGNGLSRDLSGQPLLDELPLQRAWVEIDLDAIAHNVRQLRRLLQSQTDLMAVVKADAYGHGAVTVAEVALRAGATWLGVATVTEGIELRRAGIQAPILLMGATHSADEVKAIAYWKIQPTLSSLIQAQRFAEALRAAQVTPPLPVHLILDTGMSRLGVPWQEAVAFVNQVRGFAQLQIASIYSHFATADDPDPVTMVLQHRRFEQAIAQIRATGFEPPRLHIANSAATLVGVGAEGLPLEYDMVRAGLALYGLYPAPHLAEKLALKPVLQVNARITQVKWLEAGTGISYGHRFVTDRPLKVAVVGIGYADGVPRNLSNRLEVLIQGQRVRQVGAITMDQLMLDVSALEDVEPGDRVVLLGQSGQETITANDWAAMLGTISWEILCGFKHRLPRIARVNANADALPPGPQTSPIPAPRQSRQIRNPKS